MTDIKNEERKVVIHVSSAFKIILCFITFIGIFYCIYVERDIMKALFLLNIIANYRIMLAFLTDWNEEMIFRTSNISNDAHGIISKRGAKHEIEQEESDEKNKMSNFVTTSIIDNNKYGYLNNLYDDKVNYNFITTDSNFAWWSEF